MSGIGFRKAIGRNVLGGTILTFALVQYLNFPHNLMECMLWMLSLLFLFNYVLTILRWQSYIPQKGIQDDSQLPSLSVVIPVYNESAFVQNSISSVVRSNYPQGKIQLIVVDDGSTDDTWSYVNREPSHLPHEEMLQYLNSRHEINLGKRRAIMTGFSMATNDIIVTLDSDSVLHRQALRNIVAPLVLESSIGGVAGHLSALNVSPSKSLWKTFIPRILDILFEHGGNIPRSAQTKSGFVTILPGAISAYRRDAILPHMENLVNQKFLGHCLRHGEDIEMTLNLLRDGWRSVYQSNAIVYTTVPESLAKAFLMYVRWERSSYTYMMMGFFRLAFGQAYQKFRTRIHLWLPISDTMTRDEEDQRSQSMASVQEGDFYPVLSITCTALSNIFCVGTIFIRVGVSFRNPSLILGNFCCLWILAIWSSLLFVADSSDDHLAKPSLERDHVDIRERDDYAESDRLAWKLQYSCLSLIFQVIFISWSSIIGLATLTSQSWLTR